VRGFQKKKNKKIVTQLFSLAHSSGNTTISCSCSPIEFILNLCVSNALFHLQPSYLWTSNVSRKRR